MNNTLTSATTAKPSLYQRFLNLATHPHAPAITYATSFVESSFFPFPPDLLLLPMMVADQTHVFRWAFWCTVWSVIGGLLGYAIGHYLFATLGAWILHVYGLEQTFLTMKDSFNEWAFWLIAAKGLTPIPYKFVTITSGVMGVNLGVFMAASVVARAMRFYLLAVLFYFLGPKIKPFIEKYMGTVLIASLGIIVLGFVILKIVLTK